MLNLISYKSKQFLWLVLKLVVVFVCSYFIYSNVIKNDQIVFSDFRSILIDFDVFSVKNSLLLLLFSVFNWFFEIIKWQVLVKNIHPISLHEAAKQSLSSHAFSLITPNRIGEYGAKALYYKKIRQQDILILNFIGNFYQMLVTIVVGLVGFLYLKKLFSHTIVKEISIAAMLCIVFILLIFLCTEKINFLKRWKKNTFLKLHFVRNKQNQKVVFISLLRYLIFSHQFYFLLVLFHLDISYYEAIAAISTMYLITSIIPMLSLFDFVLKGSVAIIIFDFFQVESIIIISITMLMWIFNFAIPAIIGSYFVLQFKPVNS